MLHIIWKHTGLTKRRTMQLFEALMLSKLRYATASAWFAKAELRRLDGSEAYYLRQILNVPGSYVSRASNKRILDMCGAQQLSCSCRC